MNTKIVVALIGVFGLVFGALLYVFDGTSKARKSPLNGEEGPTEKTQALSSPKNGAAAPAAAKSPRRPASILGAGPLRGRDLEDFVKKIEKKYKTKFDLSLNTDGAPFRLSGAVKFKKGENESVEDALVGFLGEVAPALDIDDPGQLVKPTRQPATLGDITNFKQEFMGIPVEGAQVRVHQDSQGNIFMVNSTYLPDVGKVINDERVSAAEARTKAYADAVARHPEGPNQIPLVREPVKVIYRFNNPATTDVAWKITISQPWVGADGMNNYFVNARTGTLERRRAAQE